MEERCVPPNQLYELVRYRKLVEHGRVRSGRAQGRAEDGDGGIGPRGLARGSNKDNSYILLVSIWFNNRFMDLNLGLLASPMTEIHVPRPGHVQSSPNVIWCLAI